MFKKKYINRDSVIYINLMHIKTMNIIGKNLVYKTHHVKYFDAG